MREKYKKGKKDQHVIKIETQVTLGRETGQVDLERRRGAIKAALQAATASLAATTSGLAGLASDGGTPPWGEVIIEPVWPERNPQLGEEWLAHSAELRFWR
jgi:hypothetical protein